ncbi:MAG: DUF1648 domain-containing protein [Deltaproteobacteria bacterium]|nr:DUF1648 domain-containing protein [Deltaproteobacteria bacterium]
MEPDTGWIRRLSLHAANAVLLLSSAVLAWRAWPGLPPQIPVHFNAEGDPDAWAPRDSNILLLLVLVPWGLTLLLYGVARMTTLLAANPAFINIPRKQEFLALPRERQMPLWRLMQETLAAVAVGVNVVFLALLSGVFRVALGAESALSPPALFIPITLTVLLTVGYSVASRRLVNRLIDGR